MPGLRPDLPRSDRSLLFFWYGLSEDGGFDDVEESLARRRSSSSHPGRQRRELSVLGSQLSGRHLVAGRGGLPQRGNHLVLLREQA